MRRTPWTLERFEAVATDDGLLLVLEVSPPGRTVAHVVVLGTEDTLTLHHGVTDALHEDGEVP